MRQNIPLGGGKSVPLDVEPSGWQYKTGSFFAPVIGEGVTTGAGAGSLVVHLTQGPYAPKKGASQLWRLMFAGVQVSVGTVSPTPIDFTISAEFFPSNAIGQIYRCKSGGATLSSSGQRFAKTQEAGAPTGLSGFCLIGSFGGQFGVARTWNVLFLGSKFAVKSWTPDSFAHFPYVTFVESTSVSLAAGVPVTVTYGVVSPPFKA